MAEPVIATVMTGPAVTVSLSARFKQVVNALLAADCCAVPVVDADRRPVGVVTEADALANLEFHGGTDPMPLLGAEARRRWRKAAALTAADLMVTPAAVIGADARVSQAARRLAQADRCHLCVVDGEMRVVGVLTRRNLLTLYRRSDNEVRRDVWMVIAPDRQRPARAPAEVEVDVRDGVVTLRGVLTFRSRVEHAAFAAARVPGVVAVRNDLTYDLDDLMVTGL